jgi:hypothetical protein
MLDDADGRILYGIRHILARSPEARGRSERCFGTIQGRLPQELRLHGVRSYAEANRYLDEQFVADFNRRFTVAPAQPGSAFTRVAGLEVAPLVSIQHERIVANDNTVTFGKLSLQLPRLPSRLHLARCPVLVHELLDDSLGVSFSGKLIARFDAGALRSRRSPEPHDTRTSLTAHGADFSKCFGHGERRLTGWSGR